MRFVRRATCVALLAGASLAQAQQHPFRFAIPEGFTDLSPGAPDANYANVHPQIVHEARSGKFATFAIDRGRSYPQGARMNAVVQEGALTTADDLVELVPQLEAVYRQKYGAPVEFVESSYVDISGVRTIRVVYDITLSYGVVRHMQYLMPGGTTWYAVLTYSSVPERFAGYRDRFDESASQTKGLADANETLSMRSAVDRVTEILSSFVIFTLVAFALQRSTKKRVA